MIHTENYECNISGGRKEIARDFGVIAKALVDAGVFGEPGDSAEGLSKMIRMLSMLLEAAPEKRKPDKPQTAEIWEFKIPPGWF